MSGASCGKEDFRMTRRERATSPTSVMSSLINDITKFFDCNNSIEEVEEDYEEEDEDEEDDLTSASGRREEENTDPGANIYPDEFRVQMKWPQLNDVPHSSIEVTCEEQLSRVMSCRCINARGAIAHGKRPGLMYEAADVTQNTVEEVFETFGKGCKKFESISEIKEELMSCGPVVSTSFILSKTFENKNEFEHSFLMTQVDTRHPLLITGWKCTEFGEVWICNHLDGAKDHIIAFGHFGIDDICLAPNDSFEDTPWQAGPYFDHDFSRVTEDWRQWPNLKMYLKSSDLERLAACFDPGFVNAVASESHFELCDKHARAHSRTCCLKEVGWDADRNKWRVTAGFVD